MEPDPHPVFETCNVETSLIMTSDKPDQTTNYCNKVAISLHTGDLDGLYPHQSRSFSL